MGESCDQRHSVHLINFGVHHMDLVNDSSISKSAVFLDRDEVINPLLFNTNTGGMNHHTCLRILKSIHLYSQH